jgi:fatty-acyl-CoA synthase
MIPRERKMSTASDHPFEANPRLSSPWLQGFEPRAGRLARARLTRRSDVEAIERFQPEDLLPGVTIFDCLRAAARLNPERPAMIALATADLATPPRILSYAELMASLVRAANLFHYLGEGRSPSVAIILPMVPEGLIAAFAAATCGLATPINPFLELHHVAALLRASKANILVTTDDAIWTKLSGVRDEVPSLRHVLFLGASNPARDFETLARRHSSDALDFIPSSASHDVVMHMPTGGTTAAPKLAKLTHSGLLTVAWSVGALMGPTEDGVVGHAMPNFHIGGTCTLGLRTLLYGQTLLTLTRDGFRNAAVIANFWDIARRFRMTSVLSTPTTAAALLADGNANADGHFITDFHCGGSTVPVALMHGFHERFGVWLRENWGMTEVHGTMTGHPNDGQQPVIGSVGATLPFFRCKAIQVDANNCFVRECEPGERGILGLGGPTVIPGYVDPALDAAYIISGMPDGAHWGNSGDVGAIDAQGYVWLFGREKDVIVRGGHNIDPKPIEEVLVQFPGVQLAAMVGKPDARRGELPVAYIQESEGAHVDLEALMDFCAQRAHERAGLPVEIILLNQMPLTPVGKISKPTLKVDILRRTVEALARARAGGAEFKTTVEMTGRRPKVEVLFLADSPAADALAQLREVLATFEFESEVRVGQ